MKRLRSAEEVQEIAALAALDALGEISESDRVAVEALRKSERVAADLDRVARALAVSAPPASPSPSLKARIMTRARAERAAEFASQFASERASHLGSEHASRSDATRSRAARAAGPADTIANPFHFLLSGEGAWNELFAGVHRRLLFSDKAAGTDAFLIRLDPGAIVAPHDHAGAEHCYVLQGDVHLAGQHLHSGDYHLASAGSVHAPISTDDGCVLLIVNARTLAEVASVYS